jgi:valyl-tRNA synthetase
MNLAPKAGLKVIIKPKSEKLGKALESSEWIYRKLIPVESNTFDAAAEKPKASAAAVIDGSEIFIPLEGLIDLGKERERIQKEIDRLTGFMKSVEGKLSNKGFVENAPEAVVEKERQKKADAEESLGKLEAQLQELTG